MIAERTTTLGDVGDLSAPPGSRPWSIAMRLEIQGTLKDATFSSERLSRLVEHFGRQEGFRQLEDEQGKPFASYETFCVARQPFGLGYSEGAIENIIAERSSVEALAAKAEPQPKHGGKRQQGSVSTLTGKRDASYLTARIARDRPDILERMKAGEFKSVRAAAKEAGIVRDPTPLDRLRKAWQKASEEERLEFVRFIHRAR